LFYSPGLRLDLDPDIVAAMDEDFDYDDPDNMLDDDFVARANAPGGSDDEDESNGSGTECGSDFNNMLVLNHSCINPELVGFSVPLNIFSEWLF